MTDIPETPLEINSSFPPQASQVRRTDVRLRALYPHLLTRILEVEPHHYLIAFDREQLDADAIQPEFEHSIRPVSVFIRVSNITPSHFVREIQPIPDVAVARGFEGYSFSFADIRDILLSIDPNLPVPHSSPNENKPITFVFDRPLTSQQEAFVCATVAGILPDWPFAIEVAPPPPESDVQRSARKRTERDQSLEVRPSRLRPSAPSFVRDDEAFWFENVDALFEGRLSPDFIDPIGHSGISCYLDASVSPQIDIRQAVLLYDTIYLTPPIIDPHFQLPTFWDNQHVTRDDVLELMEAGRVRLVLAQPEERTDPSFLSAAHERNPNAILGRMRSAALLAQDIVHTADEYVLGQPALRKQVGLLAGELSKELNIPIKAASQLLLWPLHARRMCIAPLMRRGLMGVPVFSQGHVLAAEIKSTLHRDVELEALATTVEVHVAHALNATLIPPTQEMAGWVTPRRIVGDRLNFYRAFNGRIAAAWAVNERRKEAQVRVLPPLPLFKFKRQAPIRDLIAFTALGSTRRQGRALVNRLSGLPIEEREAEMERLGQELYDLGARAARRKLVLDNLSNAKDILALILKIKTLPIKSGLGLLATCLALARRIPALDQLADVLEQDFNAQIGRSSDLDFLSKVERVAELRVPERGE
jgi:hypothetical protein